MLRMYSDFAHPGFSFMSGLSGVGSGLVAVLFIILACWTLVWKGFALWYAARNHQKAWFVFLLVISLVGIPEIIYLLWFSADKRKGTASLFQQPPVEGEPVAPAPSEKMVTADDVESSGK
jgi:hypothetical protein